MKTLKDGPYGRCVYYSDNNVVDHQTISLKFKNGVYASFTMTAFTNKITRKIKKDIFIWFSRRNILGFRRKQDNNPTFWKRRKKSSN